MKRILIQLLVFVLISVGLSAQQVDVIPNETSLTYAVNHGQVNVMEVEETYTDAEKQKLASKDRKRNRNFEKRFPHKIVSPELEHLGPDKLRQKSFPVTKNRPLDVFLNIDGLDNGNAPQDPTGDVGETVYLQAVNATLIAAFDKVTGEEVGRFSGTSLWGPVNAVSGGDPIILYDQEKSQWVITEFPSFGGGNRLLVAVSETSDPLGTYNVYSFNTQFFPDYPKYSIWNNAYVVTTNEGGAGVLDAYFINRDEITSGAQNVRILTTQVNGTNGSEQPFIVSTPVDWSGITPPADDTPPCTVSLADASWTTGQSEDQIIVDEYIIDWIDETVATRRTRLDVSPYDANPCREEGVGFSCIPQIGDAGLDGLPEIVTFQPHYRNFGTHESMVLNFISDATDGDDLAGIRWMELRKTAGSNWSLFQEGTFSPDDGLHRFMCGIAIDASGNIGMAYSTSSSIQAVGIAITGRLSTDPPGMMTLGEIPIVQGNGGLNTFGRFSDYSHITTDPVNPNVFWYTGAYAQNGSTATRIVSFQAQNSDFDVSPVQLVTPETGAGLTSSETITINIRNSGVNPASNIRVGYQLENNPVVEEILPITLAFNEEMTHEFSQTADLSELGEYNFKVFATFEADEFIGNDTIRPIVNHIPFLDLAVSDVQTPFESICGETSDISFLVSNQGADVVTQSTITINVNGVMDQQFVLEETLASGEETLVQATIGNLQIGSNDIVVEVSQPNNGIDEIPGDNSANRFVAALTTGTPVVLNLFADGFPTETSWGLFNASTDELVASSNGTLAGDAGFTNILTQFCLNASECYRFEIYDVFGDGLTAVGFDDGGYQILDENGMVLVSIINPNFGIEETNEFCIEFECNLLADIIVENASSTSGGAILVEVTNGRGPNFEYSIDGGNTFQSDNTFENLESGNYTVVVRDGLGCEFSSVVNITGGTAVQDIGEDGSIIIFPNPTTGEFNINITGLDTDRITLPVTVYNLDGKIVQRASIATFDDTYKGMVSLYHYPNGIYLVKVDVSADQQILTRVTKQ